MTATSLSDLIEATATGTPSPGGLSGDVTGGGAVAAWESWLAGCADRDGRTLEDYLAWHMRHRDIIKGVEHHQWDLFHVAKIISHEQVMPAEVWPWAEWAWIDRGRAVAGIANLINELVTSARLMGLDLAQYCDTDARRFLVYRWGKTPTGGVTA